MTLQHLSHPRMVFTYALDMAFQDIGVAAILGVLLVCLREEFSLLWHLFAFCSWVYGIFIVGTRCFSFFSPSHHIFLACTFVDFALLHFFFSHALLPVSGHVFYASGLEQDILNSF